jgi:hypothetical protein
MAFIRKSTRLKREAWIRAETKRLFGEEYLNRFLEMEKDTPGLGYTLMRDEIGKSSPEASADYTREIKRDIRLHFAQIFGFSTLCGSAVVAGIYTLGFSAASLNNPVKVQEPVARPAVVQEAEPLEERVEAPLPVAVVEDVTDNTHYLTINPDESYAGKDIGVSHFVVAWYNNRGAVASNDMSTADFYRAVTTANINDVPSEAQDSVLTVISDCVSQAGNDAVTNVDLDQLEDGSYNILSVGANYKCDLGIIDNI